MSGGLATSEYFSNRGGKIDLKPMGRPHNSMLKTAELNLSYDSKS